MTNYRRAKTPGGTYFFTVNLSERQRATLIEHIDLLKRSLREEKKLNPFRINALVILPDHLHAVLTLPDGDADYSGRWRRVKAAFSAALPPTERRSTSRRTKGERGIWQRRFWEHLIRDEGDYARHLDYVHFNPVKHGHVTRVQDWPHSTFHRFVREGKYPLDWAGGDQTDFAVGERE
ncbi:MAG: transposase [Sulfuricaulis sp.]|uniref:REP-associated tyrosine transposase n=1 Tax=Sulfuricaulis sp. TaxID=2003553 RepID=UPI0025CEA892|nr:transposase [Sulfuricaulis sp.]MCR4347182.1 transposase [Sulfuricaulis sp.]